MTPSDGLPKRYASFALCCWLSTLCGCMSKPVGFEKLESLSNKALNGSLTQLAEQKIPVETNSITVPNGTLVTYSPDDNSEPVIVLSVRKTAANNGHLTKTFNALELFDKMGIMFRTRGNTVELREYGTLSLGNRDLVRIIDLHLEVPSNVTIVEEGAKDDINWMSDPYPLPGWYAIPFQEMSVEEFARRTGGGPRPPPAPLTSS